MRKIGIHHGISLTPKIFAVFLVKQLSKRLIGRCKLLKRSMVEAIIENLMCKISAHYIASNNLA